MIFRRIWYIHVAYLLVGLSSLAIGFFVATKFIKKSYSKTYTVAQSEDSNSQPMPEDGDVPPPPSPPEDVGGNPVEADPMESTESSDTVNQAEAAATPPTESQVPQSAPPQVSTQAPSQASEPPPPAPANPSAGNVESANSKNLLPESVSLLEPYVFDTREGRRNPFKPPIVNLSAGAGADVSVGPGTPLERYEVDEVKLAAILWDIKNPKAMFIDPTGEIHILTKDDRIGRRRGYVAAIRESEVVVVEITSFSGEQQYSTRILRIDQ